METRLLNKLLSAMQFHAAIRYSLTARSRSRWERSSAPLPGQPSRVGRAAADEVKDSEDSTCYAGVRAQLEALGEAHVGYASLRLPTAEGQEVCIVGARPFSKARPKLLPA